MNGIWLIFGSMAAFAVAYRLYSAWLAAKVAVLDDTRETPAHRLKDGVDFHPTNKWVLFGHHFAAIAGPGPLIGPVMAAQWGYAPGFFWIVIGACLAGAVHDFVILWASVRSNGKTLSQIAKENIGPIAGTVAIVATIFIIICSLASVAKVVVHALSHSSWGMFTILATIPAALITGLWMYKIRPGKVGEASAIGVTIVLLGVIFGETFSHSSMAHTLVFKDTTLSIMLPAYALVASILPVWILMCPRDYLSSYMKIGVMVMLAFGIILAPPLLKMPAVTPFLDGGGPVLDRPIWPFLCIVIMCGAISGFHSLIASGTTPKMINKESDIRWVGYGAMVVEGFVAVTALVAACALEPGDYFAINADKAKMAKAIPEVQAKYNWNLAPVELRALEAGTKETLENRPGGAVTLAVGMAKVFSNLPGMQSLMSYWYHFVIMFEALFILTLLETGTRVARFVVQDALAPKKSDGAKQTNWLINIVLSIVVCVGWGGLLYMGKFDTLWNMLGISNQLLAGIALAVGTTYLLRHAKKKVYALCTGIPFVFVTATTFTAGIISVRGWWATAGKLADDAKLVKLDGLAGDALTAAQASAANMSQQSFMLYLLAVLASSMLVMATIITVESVWRWYELTFKTNGTQGAPLAEAA